MKLPYLGHRKQSNHFVIRLLNDVHSKFSNEWAQKLLGEVENFVTCSADPIPLYSTPPCSFAKYYLYKF